MGLVSRARRRLRGRAAGGQQRGSATAEIAVTLPVVAVLLGVLMSGVVAAASYLQCLDAAKIAARAVSRGESIPAARQAATSAAPTGATVSMSRAGGLVQARVAVTLGRSHGISSVLPTWSVHATASTPDESW